MLGRLFLSMLMAGVDRQSSIAGPGYGLLGICLLWGGGVYFSWGSALSYHSSVHLMFAVVVHLCYCTFIFPFCFDVASVSSQLKYIQATITVEVTYTDDL